MLGYILHLFIKSRSLPILFCACFGCVFFSAFPVVASFVPYFPSSTFSSFIMSAPASGGGAGAVVLRSANRSKHTRADLPLPVSDFMREYGAYIDSC